MREALTIMMALVLLALGAHMLARPVEYTRGRRRMPLWAVRPVGALQMVGGVVILYLAYQLITEGN